MERYIRFVVRHRVAVVAATLAVTALLGAQLGHVHLEIRRRANFPADHPYVRIQNRMSDLFGGEAVVIIGLVATRGTIYTPEVLSKVYRITRALRESPGIIETSLFSLAAPYVKAVVTGQDEMMEVRALMEEPLADPAAIEELRRTVREDKLLRQNLVSQDETATVVVAEFDDSVTDQELVARVHAIADREQDSMVRIALAGAPILRAALAEYARMIAVLFPLAVAVIGLVHYEAFRTLQAMFLPLVTALLSVVWALGIVGALRQPLDAWSALTPVLILAIAAGHAVQILKRYYEEFAVVRDTQEAVVRSIVSVGPVMLTAGCIAAAGFASLTTFRIPSVRAFGFLLASGILSALVIEMTFTPACRSLLPAPKRTEVRRERERKWLDRLLEWVAGLVVRSPRAVLLGASVVVGVSLAGAMRIEVDNSFRYWFRSSTRVRRDDRLLNEKLPGTATLRILIEGERPGVIQEPPVLKAIDDLEAFLAADPNVGGVSSLADHVKRMHRAMHGGDPAHYAIPDNQRLIAQYFLLYGMSTGPDSLTAFVDPEFRYSMIRALSKTDSAAFSRDLLGRLQRYAAERFRGLPVKVGIAGGTLGVQTAMNDVVVREKILNMIQVSAIICTLCAAVLRSLVGALFVLLPLALAVSVNFGIMGWSHTWLDMTTAAITAMGVSGGPRTCS